MHSASASQAGAPRRRRGAAMAAARCAAGVGAREAVAGRARAAAAALGAAAEGTVATGRPSCCRAKRHTTTKWERTMDFAPRGPPLRPHTRRTVARVRRRALEARRHTNACCPHPHNAHAHAHAPTCFFSSPERPPAAARAPTGRTHARQAAAARNTPPRSSSSSQQQQPRHTPRHLIRHTHTPHRSLIALKRSAAPLHRPRAALLFTALARTPPQTPSGCPHTCPEREREGEKERGA